VDLFRPPGLRLPGVDHPPHLEHSRRVAAASRRLLPRPVSKDLRTAVRRPGTGHLPSSLPPRHSRCAGSSGCTPSHRANPDGEWLPDAAQRGEGGRECRDDRHAPESGILHLPPCVPPSRGVPVPPCQ
jgi:hypothetical protein